MAEKRKTKTSSAVKNRYNNRVYGSINRAHSERDGRSLQGKVRRNRDGASASYQESD